MALAKDQTTSCSFYGNILEPSSSIQFPYMTPYEFDEYIQKEDGNGMESPSNNKMTSNQVMNYSPSLSNSSSGNSSNGFATHHHGSSFQPHEEAHSLITFKSGYENFIHSTGSSLLSFHQQGDAHRYHVWQGSSSSNSNSSNLRLLDEASKSYQDAANEWLYDEATLVDPSQECGTQQTCFNKRPQMEENMQSLKKQCIISRSKKPAKPKSSTSKDPQSIAAKNRRERISERLKILQDLVPNGSKVDLVTMLEKAISYVKFLQLQVKVLATDEFWPEAGGKAPDISQVKEAIDAILSSQRLEREKPSSNS